MMFSHNMRQLALASIAALPYASAAVPSSTFVSPQKDLVFAVNVPDDGPSSSSDLFFTMAFPKQVSWASIGLGASTMDGKPLILMAYPSSSGTNVTLSPRRCDGHTEPVYDPSIKVTTLAGTGLLNDTTFIFNGVCHNCRSWSDKGKIDVASTAQAMSYGVGPNDNMRSDNPRESVKVHWNYGAFTMDLVRATGGAGAVPDIVTAAGANITSAGAAQQSAKSGHVDTAAILHALLMILAFVGMWPFGILVLKVGNSVRWHAINQGVALGVVIIGSILGFVISKSYTRSQKFNTAHQIIGLFVFVFALAQFTLGFLHHRIYKQTKQTTKMAPLHVWLGRLIIPLGVANGFTGFPLALSPYYNFALFGVVLFVVPAFFFVLLLRKVVQRFMRSRKGTGEGQGQGQGQGYNLEPWRNVPPQQQQAAGYVSRDPGTPTQWGPPPQGAKQHV